MPFQDLLKPPAKPEVLSITSFPFPSLFSIPDFTSIMQNITFEFYISLLYLNQIYKDIQHERNLIIYEAY